MVTTCCFSLLHVRPGDRDGNPNVTWQTTKQVVTLLRWRIMELYYREVDELLYELSMSGGISQDDPMG